MTFLTTSDVILKVKWPYLKVKLVYFGHFCPKLEFYTGQRPKFGVKTWVFENGGFYRITLRPTEIIFKVKRSNFKVKLINFDPLWWTIWNWVLERLETKNQGQNRVFWGRPVQTEHFILHQQGSSSRSKDHLFKVKLVNLYIYIRDF